MWNRISSRGGFAIRPPRSGTEPLARHGIDSIRRWQRYVIDDEMITTLLVPYELESEFP
jgi:hypothetical protein